MNREKIEITLLSVISTVLKCEVSDQTSRENTPQWDSLKHIEVIFAIEDELNIQFPEDTLANLNDIKSIITATEIFYET